MFGRNLALYRLRKNLDKKELALRVGVTPRAISRYEHGGSPPDIGIVRKLAAALDVDVADFLVPRNESLVFRHAEFRKQGAFPQKRQEYVRNLVEERFSRFLDVAGFLGGDVLPDFPAIHSLRLQDDPEKSAELLRRHLNLSVEGPVHNLIGLLENKGVLVLAEELDDRAFCGMNGTVDGRPYVVVNGIMHAARMRTTLAHELAHLMFAWPESMPERQIETLATAIAGAFLLPAADARRELGPKRTKVSNDMAGVCVEYGLSMFLLAKRARICDIISANAERRFYIEASRMGWRTGEPERFPREVPQLFKQLVCRAVCENEISPQKGAELLRMPIGTLMECCSFSGGDPA